MFCNKCGKQINDISKFCNYCGAPIPTPDGVVPVIPQTRLDLEAAARGGIAQASAQRAAKPMRPKIAPPDEKKYELAVPSAPKKRQKVDLPDTVGEPIKAKKFKGFGEDMPVSASVALSGIPGCKKLVKKATKQHDELYGLDKRRKRAAADAARKKKQAEADQPKEEQPSQQDEQTA